VIIEVWLSGLEPPIIRRSTLVQHSAVLFVGRSDEAKILKMHFFVFQFRNKLKEQQNTQLNQQRDALTQRQNEIRSIDDRISELQDRLQRKRLLNQQLAKQLQHSGPVRSNKQGLISSNYNRPRHNVNVAAVEPYLHVPNAYHQVWVSIFFQSPYQRKRS